MRISVITLFPELFPGPLSASITGRALEENTWQLNIVDLREFGLGKHNQVDDTPYGGGAGMVLRPDVLGEALDATIASHDAPYQIISPSPRGVPMHQPLAAQWSGANADSPKDLIFVCGRFEAIDERILEHYQILEVSLGDFVMTGGELAAMSMIDATIRLLSGVVGDAESLDEESFGLSPDYACLLEYPHYSKPPLWRGLAVPEVLTSGNHGEIARWRKAQAEETTKKRRPDLWQRYAEDKEG